MSISATHYASLYFISLDYILILHGNNIIILITRIKNHIYIHT